MATIVTVHGTFAHIAGTADAASGADIDPSLRQWWQPGSHFQTDLVRHIDGTDGNLEFKPFIWSGNNSEAERRVAGRRLLSELRALEDKGESYCVIGHSHGGSVISSALMQSAVTRKPLKGLRRWITVGTPFVELRKERFLFQRLPILLKALFIASLMLLFMLIFYLAAEVFDGQRSIQNANQGLALAVATTVMSLPFIVFYFVARYLDNRQLFFYRKRNIDKAKTAFASKWLPLSHRNDEAINGLGSLGSVNLSIFHRDFAIPVLSLASVFILPLAYLYLVTSPKLMVDLADFLKSDVYTVESFEQKKNSVTSDRSKLREIRGTIQDARKTLRNAGDDVVAMSNARSTIAEKQAQLKKLRQDLREKHPELMQIQRVSRFNRLFLERDGKPCEGGQLCDGGRSISLNSRLLLHLATDEVASWVVDEDVRQGTFGRIIGFLVPILLVPIAFGLTAVAMVMIVQFIAGYISAVSSRYLDRLTWAEIQRSALGNDTETEVAVAAGAQPFWITTPHPFLPEGVANAITARSNEATTQSLEKFRNAISELAFSDGGQDKSNAVLNYLTWKELVHTSYFEVPGFRKLVAAAISQDEGFKPTSDFANDPEKAEILGWLNTVPSAVAREKDVATQ